MQASGNNECPICICISSNAMVAPNLEINQSALKRGPVHVWPKPKDCIYFTKLPVNSQLSKHLAKYSPETTKKLKH